MSDSNSLQTRLEKIAYKRTKPFCYSCYKEVTQSHCPTCGSDDFARLLPGEGMDWGVDWVIPTLLRDNLTPVDEDEAFEDFIRECYPETTKIGWLDAYDTVSAIRELDPISWQCEQGSWLDSEVSEEILVTFDNGSTHYTTSDVENFLDEAEGAA